MNNYHQIRFKLFFWIVFGSIGLAVVGYGLKSKQKTHDKWLQIKSKQKTQDKWLQIERQKMLERVQALGGWDVLRKDCVSLAEKSGSKSGYRIVSFIETNDLPAAIIALYPIAVGFFPPNFDGKTSGSWFNDSDFPVVRIIVFNDYHTGFGGTDKPPLGLDILCGKSTNAYNPHRLQSETPLLKYWSYQKITNDVYEFYGFW